MLHFETLIDIEIFAGRVKRQARRRAQAAPTRAFEEARRLFARGFDETDAICPVGEQVTGRSDRETTGSTAKAKARLERPFQHAGFAAFQHLAAAVFPGPDPQVAATVERDSFNPFKTVFLFTDTGSVQLRSGHFRDGFVFGVEDLHAPVAGFDHRHITLTHTTQLVIDRDFRRFLELARTRARFTERRQPFARRFEHLDPVALLIHHIHITRRLVDRQTLRFRERMPSRFTTETERERVTFNSQSR
ncbi:MAG TPA: hypothetical protein VLZ06_04790, partial [Solirubrobacteraceae bacterium]|nr:hypothetical protein [Solirubrobacteraceae bacterium]